MTGRTGTQAVCDAIARACAAAGARHAFGMPGGGPNLDLIGALAAHGIDFVLTHQETSAAIMAACVGELTHRPGVCLATRGPGAASLVNGVAQARLDFQPMLAVTDTVAPADAARVSHQRIDQRAVLGAVAKASLRIAPGGADELADAAVRLALSPPWGPVHLELVGTGSSDAPPATSAPAALDPAAVEAARALLAASRRPLIAVGVGARHAVEAVRRLVDATGWPTLVTYKAKGVVADTASSFAGVLTGAAFELETVRAADLIVALGLDPVELLPAPWPSGAPVVSLTEWAIPETYFTQTVELVAPLEQGLAAVRERLPPARRAATPGFAARLGTLLDTARAADAGVGILDVVDALAAVPGRPTLTVDAGAHMLPTLLAHPACAPGDVLVSSGLATMGFAVPAAVAAALARPGRPVVCLTGDGGLGMCLAELETIARRRLPVTVVVVNDSSLSLIAVKQQPARHGGRAAVRFGSSDYAAVAGGLGLDAATVHEPETLGPALDAAVASGRPWLLDVIADPAPYRPLFDTIRGPA